MKKIRAYVIVDLEVADDFNPTRELAVVQYIEKGNAESYLPKSAVFEVLDYVSVMAKEIE